MKSSNQFDLRPKQLIARRDHTDTVDHLQVMLYRG